MAGAVDTRLASARLARMLPEISRRRALRMFAVGSAFSNVIGQAWSEPLLYELQPLAASEENGSLRVDLSEFPALNQPLGSVRISTSALDAAGRRQLGLFAPVIINRDAGGQLHVLSAACTHEDCVVRRLDPGSQRMFCPCHGSQFGADGRVMQGPAQRPLEKRAFTQDGSVLRIELPAVFYQVTHQRIGPRNRVEISFIAFDKLTYEIHFRDGTDAAPQRVSFALSADGPANQTEIKVVDDFAKVYVDLPGKAGIFQIVMKTQVV